MVKGRECQAILFVHGVTEIGGAERELLLILDRLPEFGYRAVVVCPDGGPLVEELNRRAISRRSVLLPPWRKLVSYPQRAAAVRRLRDVILAERPALLHVNDIWWVPQTLRAAEGAEIPVLAHVRQEIEPRKVRRYELGQLDQVLPVSRQIRSSLEVGGIQPERLRTLYSGIDLKRFLSSGDGREIRHHFGIQVASPVVGTVANLSPRKGYEVMIRALPVILDSWPDTQYLIIGAGEPAYERTVRSLVKVLQLEKHVRFVGFQESVSRYLAAMDVYVHPALMEGFGIALLEAMAMCKPVVATATGGVPEIVRDGETGILVPPGDADALARAVVNLLADSPRRVAFGQAGRDRLASRFTVDAMLSQLTAVYETLIRRTIPATEPVLE